MSNSKVLCIFCLALFYNILLCARGQTYQDIYWISMTIKRKEVFFLLNIFFPVLFVGTLNVLIFLIPEDEGETVGFSITILLAMAVYMEVVSDQLPSNSENMPYMTTYIFMLFSISVLCCIDTLIIVWLHNKEEEEEKRQKRQSILTDVFAKVKNINTFKLPNGSDNKSKVFPATSDGSSKVDEPTQETEGTPVKLPPLSMDSSHSNEMAPVDGIAKAKILLQSLKDGASPKLPSPEIKSKEHDSKAGPVNRYRNLARKLNLYSAIVFGLVSLILTLVFFIMITT